MMISICFYSLFVFVELLGDLRCNPFFPFFFFFPLLFCFAVVMGNIIDLGLLLCGGQQELHLAGTKCFGLDSGEIKTKGSFN